MREIGDLQTAEVGARQLERDGRPERVGLAIFEQDLISERSRRRTLRRLHVAAECNERTCESEDRRVRDGAAEHRLRHSLQALSPIWTDCYDELQLGRPTVSSSASKMSHGAPLVSRLPALMVGD